MACHPPLPDMWSRCLWALLLSSSLLLGVLPGSSEAQITLDGSLGPRGPLQGPNYRIGAELGQIRGSNLFHSFDQFNVPTRGSATFAGPNTIANIVSWVTGGQPSAIDGVLRSEIAGANLYLLNPSGVLFGPNASLDVSGSFHVSTADYLRFADGAKFFASLAQESVLTVASPAAFGFLGTNPAAMTLEGTRLRVNEGEALSVVGGDLTLAGGHLEAPSGRIQLASVAAPGEVGFSPLELAPDLQGDGFARLGRIALSQGASVKVGAEGSRHAGTIAVVGGQLTLSRGSRLSATTNSGGEGGRIVVTASTVRLMEDGRLEVDTTGQGNGGTIALRVGTLTLTGGARISSRTSGSGQAGTVTVAATEAITMTDSDLNVESRDTPSSRGAAGRIVVTAPTARLMGSEITARARSMSGNGGTIALQVGTLTVTDGSDISTSTNGTGQAGPLTITAREAIAIAGRDRNGGESILSIRTRSQRSSGGEGGRLVIVTPRLSIGDGGLIRGGTLGEGNGGTIALQVGTLTVDGGTISVITTGEGSGGTIALQVGTLTLTNGGGITAGTEGPGQGGRLIITAREAVTITGQARTGVPSRLSSNATGSGAAGRIVVDTPRLSISDGGTIRAFTTREGNAGAIALQVGTLTLTNGGTITTSTSASGQGGPLTVAAREAIVIAGHRRDATPSELVSTTQGPGPGGNLQIMAQRIELRDGGTIAASSSGTGLAGTLLLQAGETFRSERGAVTVEAAQAGGGAIALRAGRLVQLTDSQLTTSVRGGGW